MHLESKVKIQNDPNKQITTTTESSVPWSDFNFPKVCSKILLNSSTLRRFLSGLYGATYVAYSKLCRGKLFKRKRKPVAFKFFFCVNCRSNYVFSYMLCFLFFWKYKGGGSKRFKKVIRIVRRYWETLGDCYKFRMVLLQGRGKATSHTFS